MDIGALDVKERVENPSTRAIVLTEDEITSPLAAILESSGFDMSKTSVSHILRANLYPPAATLGQDDPKNQCQSEDCRP